MGLFDLLEYLIPAYVIYKVITGFAGNKKKTNQDPAHPQETASTGSAASSDHATVDPAEELIQSFFSDKQFGESESHITDEPNRAQEVKQRPLEKETKRAKLPKPSATAKQDEFKPHASTYHHHDFSSETQNPDQFDEMHGFKALKKEVAAEELDPEEDVELHTSMFEDPQSLRQAIIMKEVLDKPKALQRR